MEILLYCLGGKVKEHLGTEKSKSVPKEYHWGVGGTTPKGIENADFEDSGNPQTDIQRPVF